MTPDSCAVACLSSCAAAAAAAAAWCFEYLRLSPYTLDSPHAVPDNTLCLGDPQACRCRGRPRCRRSCKQMPRSQMLYRTQGWTTMPGCGTTTETSQPFSRTSRWVLADQSEGSCCTACCWRGRAAGRLRSAGSATNRVGARQAPAMPAAGTFAMPQAQRRHPSNAIAARSTCR